MYAEAVQRGPTSWEMVEDPFLRAMEVFDANVASGFADQGDRQNGKGDFFNDLLALVLENCSSRDGSPTELHNRGAVPGFIFPRHNLDITFPSRGLPQLLIEAKAVGTPKHPKSPKQKPIGRPGSSDLPKRVKEAAFKTIDLKAEFDRRRTMTGEAAERGAGGNLTTWLRRSKPSSYLMVAARVVSGGDLASVQQLARAGAQIMDGVGVFAFRPVSEDEPTTYERVPVDRDIELTAVLHRACTDLVGFRQEAEIIPAAPEPSPGARAAATLDAAGIEPDDDEDAEMSDESVQ